ncbi:unnamed protein product [Protopolystoma xenopodis]|uniref:Uncharacterized protein n=1 Tax=Protopolystoma xenopodis TaxID=117903 RepID=A0A3S5A9W3_9PLAT|nr:unnamed protein product [Protopolystoma xenopodis]
MRKENAARMLPVEHFGHCFLPRGELLSRAGLASDGGQAGAELELAVSGGKPVTHRTNRDPDTASTWL